MWSNQVLKVGLGGVLSCVTYGNADTHLGRLAPQKEHQSPVPIVELPYYRVREGFPPIYTKKSTQTGN